MSTVSERMSKDIAAVNPDATLIEAAQLMRSSGAGAVPVLDRAGACAGILTERDIVVRVLAEEREPLAAYVRVVATMDPITCSPEEDTAVVAKRMRDNEVQHLPVCEAGDVVGLLSLADIAFGRPDEERGMLSPPPLAST